LGFAAGWLGDAWDCAGAGSGPGEAWAFNFLGLIEIVNRSPQLRVIAVFLIFKVCLDFITPEAPHISH
jgi:hypothetical protein